MLPTALITGITGQDGSYLAELLLAKGYRVVGVVRRTSHDSYERIQHLVSKVEILPADLLDQHSLRMVMQEVMPDEVYNLAAQSFVPTSWNQPVLTGEFTALGVTRLLDAVRLSKPDAKFYQASSSEMFGKVRETPQTETTPFYPRSPYGVAKVYGHYITVNYRESYGMYAVSGILFNHESPRRGLEFVTRKITHQVARIKLGQADSLSLGTLEARRDWGFAGDYVDAMWRMLQRPTPEDYVVGTGVMHSVRDCCELAFGHVGLDWKKYVKHDTKFDRPAEVEILLADPSKAKRDLGWTPKVDFKSLMGMMVDADPRAAFGQGCVTVLVTGANGFVGRWVVRALLAAGHSVVGATGPGGQSQGTGLDDGERAAVRWVSLDLTDTASARAVAKSVYDAVIHLAGVASGGDAVRDPGAAWTVNAGGTARLFDELGQRRKAGAMDPVVLLASTAEVYGKSSTPLVETDAVAPVSPYAASKRGAELAAAETASRTGLRVVIARAFPHTGPGQDARFVAPAFAERLAAARKAGARAVNVGNLDVTRDFLDVRDVARAYLALVTRGAAGETYNVASGRPLTLRALFDQIAGIVGVDAIPECDASLMRPTDIPFLVGDASRLRHATGWAPSVPFATTLQDLVHAQAS